MTAHYLHTQNRENNLTKCIGNYDNVNEMNQIVSTGMYRVKVMIEEIMPVWSYTFIMSRSTPSIQHFVQNYGLACV